MSARSPYIDADHRVTLVPSSLHNAGSGVDELGDLVLNTRGITRLDQLVEEGLMQWWAGVAGVPMRLEENGVGERETLLMLFSLLALPAALAVEADAGRKSALQVADEGARPSDVPAVDVLIHPGAVKGVLAVEEGNVAQAEESRMLLAV